MLSHILRTVLPAQLTICVTLFAVMNSKSYRDMVNYEIAFTYLGCKFISDEKTIFDLNGSHEIIV